jgi:hypothetical protein
VFHASILPVKIFLASQGQKSKFLTVRQDSYNPLFLFEMGQKLGKGNKVKDTSKKSLKG